MIRDHDRNETEMRDLRTATDRLDGALRRFASGDVRSTLQEPFSPRLEGMRRDFNRGVSAIGRTVDAVLGGTQDLRNQSSLMREELAEAGRLKTRRADGLSKAAAQAAAGEWAASQQVAATRHLAAIAEKAKLDMRRPKQAIAEATGMIDRLEHDDNRETRSAQLAALRDKSGQIERELHAMELYLAALTDQCAKLSDAAASQAGTIASLRTRMDELARDDRTNEAETVRPDLILDRMDRSVGDIDREASRFLQVTVVTPPPIDPSPFDSGPFDPSPLRRSPRAPFLRLVKSGNPD